MRRVGCLSLLVAACRCLGDGWVVADPINSRLGARFIEDWSFPVLPVVPGKARKGVCGSQPPHTQEKVNLEGGRGQATIPWRGGGVPSPPIHHPVHSMCSAGAGAGAGALRKVNPQVDQSSSSSMAGACPLRFFLRGSCPISLFFFSFLFFFSSMTDLNNTSSTSPKLRSTHSCTYPRDNRGQQLEHVGRECRLGVPLAHSLLLVLPLLFFPLTHAHRTWTHTPEPGFVRLLANGCWLPAEY
jgi:hypothetical protein